MLDPSDCVEQASDGVEALRRIEADPPALVLTDMRMDGMDGAELARVVHARYPWIQFCVAEQLRRVLLR